MTKNWTARLVVLVAVMTLITASLVSGTFAKYTTEVSGTDTVRVAKFAFDVSEGSTDMNTTGTAIDIFSMAPDDGVTTSPAGIIAPGTTGSFALDLSNTSEVDVDVAFTLTETNPSDVPVYYLYNTQRYSDVLTGAYTGDNAGTYQTIAQLATAMEAAAAGLSEATDGVTASELTYALTWVWAFDSAGSGQSDEADTALGLAGTPEITLEITCTATQADI